jgi:dTDP-4-amino-4,6-dideoxygalactose transaminase
VVPVVDLTRRHRRYASAFGAASERVLGSGVVLLGQETAALEQELVLHLHPSAAGERAVTVASGASGLQLALTALGVGPGDEVIVPDHTAVPTASAVCAVGATPVPVDVDADTAALDAACTAAACTAATRAIIVVHLYGRPAPVVPLVALGIPVIEDAAQAHGALPAVTGAAAVYSFYPTKNIGGIGDGGAIVSSDSELVDRVRLLRAHGMSSQYIHVDISQNHRLSELEAAWLRLQLPALAADNDRRRAIARRYHAAAPGLRWQADHEDHVFHQCVARVADRERFRAALGDRGVASAVHYPLTIGQQPAYERFRRRPAAVAERWAATCVSLPCFPELTDAEVDHVADALEALGT